MQVLFVFVNYMSINYFISTVITIQFVEITNLSEISYIKIRNKNTS